jgi:hypothetical protein
LISSYREYRILKQNPKFVCRVRHAFLGPL